MNGRPSWTARKAAEAVQGAKGVLAPAGLPTAVLVAAGVILGLLIAAALVVLARSGPVPGG